MRLPESAPCGSGHEDSDVAEDLSVDSVVKSCVRRVKSWRVPPNWSEPDWIGEVVAMGRAAAHEACCAHDTSHGASVPSFVMSRVMARILTRYRQEWNFGRRAVEWTADAADQVWHRIARHDDTTESVRQAVLTLNDADRFILIQLFWNGHEQSEVARVLGISQPAISRRRRIILMRLRSLLA